MHNEIQTLIDGARAHLRFAELRYGQGDVARALDQVAATRIYLPDLEALMLEQIDSRKDVTLAKTEQRADGRIDLYIRDDAQWRRLGIAEDAVDLSRLVTVCGYEAKVSSVPYKANVKHYFAMARLGDGIREPDTAGKEAAHA